ncbi:unnamed protein product [Malus baccata var. baccata]|uniref:Uncharacterized protein n=1 Tax=Malus domestica TaxID=3750 RepID=A0A498JC10_MALDO|nr:hypothetical protein DVH24_020667 [Malus domestica]
MLTTPFETIKVIPFANSGESIPKARVVKKVFRSLPTRFQPKIADLNGALQTYETYEIEFLDVKKSKNMALKAVKNENEGS